MYILIDIKKIISYRRKQIKIDGKWTNRVIEQLLYDHKRNICIRNLRKKSEAYLL